MPDAIITPLPAAITEIPAVDCRPRSAKKAKLVFQRTGSDNYFDGTASPSTAISLANSWSGLADASDDTKVSVSGIAFSVEIAEPTVFTNGENIHGNTRNVGKSGSMVTAIFRNPTAAEMTAYHALAKESCGLGVLFIDAAGNFDCRQVATSIHTTYNISPDTMVVTDPGNPGGDVGEDDAKIMFALEPEWSSEKAVVAPASGFNPLTAIVPT